MPSFVPTSADTLEDQRLYTSARLVEVVARNLMFEFSVSDEGTEVANGTHRRVIVDRARFLGATD